MTTRARRKVGKEEGKVATPSFVRPHLLISLNHFVLSLFSSKRVKSSPALKDWSLSLPSANIRGILLRVNMSKADASDNTPGRVLKNLCQLAGGCYYRHFQPHCYKRIFLPASATIVPVRSAVSLSEQLPPFSTQPCSDVLKNRFFLT